MIVLWRAAMSVVLVVVLVAVGVVAVGV